jgi:hypothetical protein
MLLAGPDDSCASRWSLSETCTSANFLWKRIVPALLERKRVSTAHSVSPTRLFTLPSFKAWMVWLLSSLLPLGPIPTKSSARYRSRGRVSLNDGSPDLLFQSGDGFLSPGASRLLLRPGGTAQGQRNFQQGIARDRDRICNRPALKRVS